MAKKTSIWKVPYIPAVAAATLLWFGGSAYWYVCQTQELCETTESAQVAEVEETQPVKETVVTTPDPVETVPVVEEPVESAPAEPAFDTTQTITALYEPDQSTFRNRTWETKLGEFADYLKSDTTKRVEIAGYAASVSNDIDEQALSKSRAQALADQLIAMGVKSNQISVVAKAYLEPIGSNDTEEGRAQNRRAVIRFK